MKNYIYTSKYFYGNQISDYGLKNGYMDYATLAKSFDHVLINEIEKLFGAKIDGEYSEPEIINGFDFDDEKNNYVEIFQYYIISEKGAEILQELTNEIVYYFPPLDCYIWGVTHFGTAWDYVLTDIKLDIKED